MVMVMVIATIKKKFNSDGNDDDGDDIDNDDGGVWFALLWRGWLKLFQNNSQGVGALLRWVGLPFVLIGLLFCGGGG